MKRIYWLGLLIVWSLAACSGGAAEQVAKPDPTATPSLPAPTLDPETLPHLLFEALSNDDLATIEQVIAAGGDVNRKNSLGMAPLEIAAIRGQAAIVQALLEAGAELTSDAFYQAISGGYMEIVQLFLDQGVDVNAPDDIFGGGALIVAARGGQVEIGRLLIAHGADLEQGDQWNDPALNVAAFRGQLAFAQMLVEQGAVVNVPNVNGSTALNHAQNQGNTEVVDFLLQVGATGKEE